MKFKFFKKIIRNPILALKSFNRDYFRIGLSIQDSEINYMRSWSYGKLERIELKKIFPGIENIHYQVMNPLRGTSNMSLTLLELNYICAIVKFTAPERVLEIGTFDGGATLNIAANSPESCKIHTIDLPPDFLGLKLKIKYFNDNISISNQIGCQFKESIYKDKIEQILCDSAEVDYTAFNCKFNLIFIDGCHDYSYIKFDSERAMEYISKGGIIIWHDYGMIESVSSFVDNLAIKQAICPVQGTRLAIGIF